MKDGKYVVMIKDSTNSGLGESHYLMHIGTFVQPLAVYPAGGPVGEELKVKLLGDANGIMPREDDHARAELYVRGAAGHVGEELQHVGTHRVVVEVMLDAPD